MPFVTVSLLKGKSPEHIHAIADGVHRALIATYEVPVNDRFQIIHQLEPGELIYDPDYLGIHRSDDVVFIHVVAADFRDVAAKQAFYKACADRLAASPGLRREDVQIVISPNGREDWSFGNGVAAYPASPPADAATA